MSRLPVFTILPRWDGIIVLPETTIGRMTAPPEPWSFAIPPNRRKKWRGFSSRNTAVGLRLCPQRPPESTARVAEKPSLYAVPSRTVTTCALILHDVGTKTERKDQVDAFALTGEPSYCRLCITP